MQEIINRAENVLLHTYNRYQVVFDHGEGVTLYDADGKAYLDFVSGIGVFALGYGNKEYNDAVKKQIDKITYFPIYMLMFLQKKELPESLIYTLDLSGVQ